MFTSSTIARLTRKPETLRICDNWRGRPSPGPIPSCDWDHHAIIDAEVAEYLLWRYRNTRCTLHHVTITPKGASVLWRHQENFFPVQPLHVHDLAREMAEGRFVFTGESIRLNSDMRIADGNHRLIACICAQASFVTNLTFGVDSPLVSL